MIQNKLLLKSILSLESLTHFEKFSMALLVSTFKHKEISYHTAEVSLMEYVANMITQSLLSVMETKEELTIGLFATHGAPHGVKVVTSGLRLMETAKLHLTLFLLLNDTLD